jgi:hypothetical protein
MDVSQLSLRVGVTTQSVVSTFPHIHTYFVFVCLELRYVIIEIVFICYFLELIEASVFFVDNSFCCGIVSLSLSCWRRKKTQSREENSASLSIIIYHMVALSLCGMFRHVY